MTSLPQGLYFFPATQWGERHNLSLESTFSNLLERQSSEQSRFQRSYGVDVNDDKNFDFIIDTTAATPQEVACLISDLIIGADILNYKYWLCTKNLFPTEHVRCLTRGYATDNKVAIHHVPIVVVEHNRDYLIFDGHKQTSAGIIAGATHVPAVFVRDKNDTGYGETPEGFFQNALNLSLIYDWEDAHKFKFSHYPVPIGHSRCARSMNKTKLRGCEP